MCEIECYAVRLPHNLVQALPEEMVLTQPSLGEVCLCRDIFRVFRRYNVTLTRRGGRLRMLHLVYEAKGPYSQADSLPRA